MGFCFLGYQYLTDREATLVSEVANTSRTNLFSLDDSFRKLGESYEKDWHKLLPILASDDHKKIRRRLSGKLASNELVTVEVRDDNAVMQFTEVNELFFEGMREVSEAFSRFCIDTALGSSLKDGVDPVLSMIITAPEGGMYFLFDRPGEIHPLRFGPVPLLIMWKIIENIRNEKLYVFIVQSANVLLKRLVEKRLSDKHSSSKDSAYITLARHNQSDEWFPARPAGGKELKKFAARLIFSNKPQDHEVTIKGKTWLVTGQNGKYADGYSFYSFYPKRIVTQNLANIKKLLAAGILLFFLVALLTANILSHTFLVPVSRLSEGVEAIKNRNGEFRIETDQNDEFGDLAMSFNHMIEDLKEMQLAKDVQESLLPTNFLAIPGYELTFTNRMASDVGGDYFDLQRLDDNRVFLLIGDVTGHGVSSALVMAMAKAIVYQGLKEGRTLIELFADLNIAVHTYFKIPPARKMITLFAAILDQQTSTLSCANAGHNFPLKIMPNGKCEDLNAVHLPIGAGKKLRNLQICDYQLNQEDFVVFYTDGIIEVKNDLDEMYGYERFRKHLSSLAGCSAQDILQELEKSYDSYLLEAEPEDDITVIVLKKI
jgi:HAMP domain-containing protein